MDRAGEQIVRSYEGFDEDRRLDEAYGTLQRLHTQEILARYLTDAPMDIVDVGGATGAYAFWLADRGHRVHLIDLTPRHIATAKQRNTRERPLVGATIADGRSLPLESDSADAIVLHGPLYHLAERDERDRVWTETRRVLKVDGLVFAFAITRHAGLLYALASGRVFEDDYHAVVMHELRTGVRDNDPPKIRSLLKAYFHLPDELEAEMHAHDFAIERTIGVAGPAWNVPDADTAVRDAAKLERLLTIARATEDFPSLSQGMVAIGRKTAT